MIYNNFKIIHCFEFLVRERLQSTLNLSDGGRGGAGGLGKILRALLQTKEFQGI